MKIQQLALKSIIKNKHKIYPNLRYQQLDCCLIGYQTLLLPHCFILCHEKNEEMTDENKLIQFAQQEAHRLSQQYTKEPNNFILIISGQNVRKCDNWHLHIFIVKNRWQKAYAYQILALKNFGLSIINSFK